MKSSGSFALLRDVFSFPHPVNEVAARSVAFMVMGVTLAAIVTDVSWLILVLAYGFLARVLTGPTLSPLGLLATRVIAPKILRRTKLVAGPPKRFAQAIGLLFACTAALLNYGFSQDVAADAVLVVLAVFAGLESIFGFCAGCFVFSYLMRWGMVPKEICDRCANVKLVVTKP